MRCEVAVLLQAAVSAVLQAVPVAAVWYAVRAAVLPAAAAASAVADCVVKQHSMAVLELLLLQPSPAITGTHVTL